MKTLKSILIIAIILLFTVTMQAQEIFDAIKNKDLTKVKILIEKDPALVNLKDDNDKTSLHIATAEGVNDIATFLMERGANVNAQNKRGFAPLYSVAQKNNLELAKQLVEKGADVNTANAFQTTPLFAAVESDNNEMVTYLLKSGANVNHVSSIFGTPLHRAMYMDKVIVTQNLLDNGANTELTDANGATPLHTAALLGRIDCARLIVNKGANIDALDLKKMSPLHYAVQWGSDRAGINHSIELARLLIEKGAKVNTIANDSTTPFLSAVRQGYTEIAALILDKMGDKYTEENNTTITPLQIASMKGYADVVDLLLSRGGNVHARNRDGKTAMDYALEHGNQSIASKLDPDGIKTNNLETGTKFLSKTLLNNEAYIWYLNHRGWAVKTQSHVFVFDNEEMGRKPDNPSLSNGWISVSELRDQNVIALYSAYHAEPNSMEFIHAKEDSFQHITYIQYKEDRWRGGQNTLYIAGREIQKIDDVEIIPYETHDAGNMGSLGYLIKTGNFNFFYTNFLPEDINLFKTEIDFLSEKTTICDLAFVEATPGQENLYASYLIEKLKPKVIIPYDRSGRVSSHKELSVELKQKYPNIELGCAQYPGDRYHIKNGKLEK